ncbi:TetR/AcrR family transcriptional regulator [Pseudoruegeria sp. HB172150]|uniref:TetR/AcrR family transcriptional regulator n=1 Tax=Pseudoruegeria sp. HB172150 TaxID=2721164 RepID=UPI001C12E109|nr:TetR/AcrR family transcriptional regulator [Pseudoruegeria sp. HB172150]
MTDTASRPGPGRPPSMTDPVGSILGAAAGLFAGKGYEGASLQDVARAVGMTKAGIYHYFGSKQDLYDAIVLSVLSDMLENAQAAVAQADGHDTRLRAFMVSHGRYLQENHDKYRASFIGRAGGDTTGYTENQIDARRNYTRFLEQIIRDGCADGAFETDDVPTTARGILGMLNWMARWYQPTGPKNAAEIADGYATLILAGLAPR